MDQPEHVLVVREPDGGASGIRPQYRRRAPVACEPARVRAEQDGVHRRGGRMKVLGVLQVVALQARRRDDEGRRTFELRRVSRAGRLLQAPERPSAEHAEAPGLREVVVGREAREVEQLLELLTRHGLLSERLVRAPRLDRLDGVHRAPVYLKRLKLGVDEDDDGERRTLEVP